MDKFSLGVISKEGILNLIHLEREIRSERGFCELQT